jgi:hypothetical protein
VRRINRGAVFVSLCEDARILRGEYEFLERNEINLAVDDSLSTR